MQALPVAQQESIETLQAEIARLKKENEQVQALKDEIQGNIKIKVLCKCYLLTNGIIPFKRLINQIYLYCLVLNTTFFKP